MLQTLIDLRKANSSFPEIAVDRLPSQIILRNDQYRSAPIDASLLQFCEYQKNTISNLNLPFISQSHLLSKHLKILEKSIIYLNLLKLKHNLLRGENKKPAIDLIHDFKIEKSHLVHVENKNRIKILKDYALYLENFIEISTENLKKTSNYFDYLKKSLGDVQMLISKSERFKETLVAQSTLLKSRRIENGNIINLTYGKIYYDILVKIGLSVQPTQLYNIDIIPDLILDKVKALNTLKSKRTQKRKVIQDLLRVKFGVHIEDSLIIPEYPQRIEIPIWDLGAKEERLNELVLQLKAMENSFNESR
eukprot:NODE_88_length_21789_cov_0.534440.p7 type:complete len:306 gc:universal NODE_88_length_21789_cov_0.534440:423-1340(+)